MTKKDFILLASALKQSRPALHICTTSEEARWREVCFAIADACATANPRFDRPKFLDACGTNT